MAGITPPRTDDFRELEWWRRKALTSPVETKEIADLAVTNAKINDLNAEKITAGTLDADRIDAGSIGAEKLNVTQLSAISADLGTITAGSINAATATITNLNASNITSGGMGVSRINSGSVMGLAIPEITTEASVAIIPVNYADLLTGRIIVPAGAGVLRMIVYAKCAIALDLKFTIGSTDSNVIQKAGSIIYEWTGEMCLDCSGFGLSLQAFYLKVKVGGPTGADTAYIKGMVIWWAQA